MIELIYEKKKSKLIKVIATRVVFVLMIYYIINSIPEMIKDGHGMVSFIMALSFFIVQSIDIIVDYRNSRNHLLRLDSNGLDGSALDKSLSWIEIESLKVDYGFQTIRLIVNLKDNKQYLKRLNVFQWVKAQLNIGVYNTPVIISLEELTKESGDVAKEIHEFSAKYIH